ncbi:uncharacterized protein [Branchiostoma lanceolatum]|uniref:uncharacterized protein n=1 Tax=Branchiostoma lanceolatum TaxID=7740 RepID=UPI003454FD17
MVITLIIFNCNRIMAIYYRVILLLSVSTQLCLTDESYNFTVSVPTNAKPGTDVVSVQSLMRMEKEELPCVIVEGDLYGRFTVSTNCTIVVARPLDSSVQSKYLLKIRVRRLQNPGDLVVRLKVNVTNVLGYPPVYNETCKTPVRHSVEGTSEFLFSGTLTAEFETTSGDVMFLKETLNKPREVWDMDSRKLLIITGNTCQFSAVFGVRGLNDVMAAAELFQSHHVNFTLKVFCQAESGQMPKVSVQLFSTQSKLKSDLHPLEQVVPNVMAKLQHPPLVYLFSVAYPTKSPTRYNCKFPSLQRPIMLSTDLDTVRVKHVQRITLDVNPVGCAPGKYGLLCDKTCICENSARCHGFNGACKCTDGWQGVACDIPKPGVSVTMTPSDPSDIFISANIIIHCQVHHLDVNTLSLRLPNESVIVSYGANRLDKTLFNIQSKDSGPYVCQVRDTRRNTFKTTIVLDIANCPPNKKGQLCDERCDCSGFARCDRWVGCVCPPGRTGTRCETTCPDGTYGKDCGKACSCQHGAICSNSDGTCTCTAGWYGSDCNVRCPKYRYGLRCQQACTCKNDAVCDNVDGSCACVAPWTGKDCDEKQPTRSEPLVESLVPVGCLIVLVVFIVTILYKKNFVCRLAHRIDGETEAVLEIEQVEADLAQAVRPGWLSRWETTSRHLTLGHLIGLGEFGHVIQGTLETSDAEIGVAAKSVRRKDTQCYRNFYREAAILVAVHEDQHHDNFRSNIIRLLGLINESSHKYILLEYASKGNLLRLMRREKRRDGAQSFLQCLRYAVHIARALQELQRLAITHCDVAARNVLITADDVAKLADFGLARDVYATVQYVADDGNGKEELAENLESEVFPLNWMSLESLETGQYTCQSDVWSFGVLLWEISTLGQEPRYDGNNRPSCLRLARTLRRGIRLRRPPECSGEMYDVMSSCWQENPSARPGADVVEKRLLRLNLSFEMETAV